MVRDKRGCGREEKGAGAVIRQEKVKRAETEKAEVGRNRKSLRRSGTDEAVVRRLRGG